MRFRSHQAHAHAATLKLLLLFALLVVVIVLAANAVLAVAYRLMFWASTDWPEYFFATNTGVVLLFVLGGVVVESMRIAEGGAAVAQAAGARPAQVSSNTDLGRLERRFANVVTEMAIASRMRRAPEAWVLHRDDAINALAAGWHEDDHIVAVTRGALERLTREELQGVVAHEFAHLKHGDTALFMRLIGLVWGLQMIHGFGRALTDGNDAASVRVSALFGYALRVAGSLGWAGGRLLQAAVARQREFHADASAVEYTRLAAGLGGALRKIAHQSNRATHGARADRRADALHTPGTDGVAHLLLHHRSAWWSTHPPLHLRLQRIYGRLVEPLPDPVLALPRDEPLLSFVAAQPCAQVATANALARDAAPTHVLQLDPTQPPVTQALAADMQDALMRMDRWHGPLERRAAVLALLLDVDDKAGWQRWAERVNHAATSQRVRADLSLLDRPNRHRVFNMMVERLCRAPATEHATVRRDARWLVGTPATRLASTPTAGNAWRPQLRRLALLRMIRRHTRPPSVAMLRLDDNLPAAVMASVALARLLADSHAATWLGAVLAQWQATQVAAPVWPHGPMRRLLRLHPMERPRVVSAWLQATRTQGLSTDETAQDVLALAGMVMDTPSVGTP